MKKHIIKYCKTGAVLLFSVFICTSIYFSHTISEPSNAEKWDKKYGISEGRFDCVDSPVINMMLLSKILNTNNKDDLWKQEIEKYENSILKG